MNIPEKPGVYTLIIEVIQPIRRKIGKLGDYNFPIGFYTYTGSALGSRSGNLKKRINRHLSTRKKEHWHIDYLLNSPKTKIRAVVYGQTLLQAECRIAQKLEEIGESTLIIKEFGASDCKKGCQSHLHYFTFNLEMLVEKTLGIFKQTIPPSISILRI